MNKSPRNAVPVVEAAKILGVTRSYVTRMLRDRRLKGRKITNVVWAIDGDSLEKYRRVHACN